MGINGLNITSKSRGNLQNFQRYPAFFQPNSATRTAVISQVCSSKKPRPTKRVIAAFVLRQLYPSMLTIARTYAVAAAGHAGSVAR